MWNNNDRNMEWLCYQVYFHIPDSDTNSPNITTISQVCDDLITLFLPQWVAQQSDYIIRYFFIRYYEEGYHLRLRLYANQASFARLKTFLDAEFNRFFKVYQVPLCLTFPITINTLYGKRLLVQASYEPEMVKYGGEQGIALAEDHFCFSTQLSQIILQSERETGVPRFRYAMDLLVQLLIAFDLTPYEQVLWLKSYAWYWMPSDLSEMEPLLQANYEKQKERMHAYFDKKKQGYITRLLINSQPNPFQMWQDHLADLLPKLKLAEETKALKNPLINHYQQQCLLLKDCPTLQKFTATSLLILPNFVHMLHNRLGLNSLREMHVAYLLSALFNKALLREPPPYYPLVLEPEAFYLMESVQ